MRDWCWSSVSFRPEAGLGAWRASLRHRATWPDSRAAHVQPRQQALQPMHGPWMQVLSDLTGTTGLAILRAIVATAHTLARIISAMLTHRTPFRDLGPEEDEQRARAREIADVRKKAAKLGLTLVESPA